MATKTTRKQNLIVHPPQHCPPSALELRRTGYGGRAAAILGAVAALVLPVAGEEKWSFEVAPYLWVANLGVETSLPQLGPGTSPNVQRFDTRLSGGLLLAAQARYGPVGVLVDVNWLQLSTESLHPGPLYSSVDLRTDYSYTTAALTYALPLRGKFHAEVLAGARVWYVASDFKLNSGLLPGRESSTSETWVDGLVGLNLRYDLTRHWLLLTRGTVGGFAGSDIQWDVFAGGGYQFTDWGMVTLGYRYLRQEYNQGKFTCNADAQGFLLGVVFKF